MKRCPECRRDYYDDTLLYCLDDGNALLEGPANRSESPPSAGGEFSEDPRTAILPGNPVRRAEDKRHQELVPNGPQKSESFWVAVLPFRYSGSDSDIRPLADGFLDDIVTGLSRFSYLRVIGRGSTSRYSDDPRSSLAIGNELGARYVIEGSLRQAGAILRVTVQLVDAGTGAHLWAETYNHAFSRERIFEIQDELIPRIVSSVADQYGALVHSMSESLRGKKAGQYSAHDAVLRAFGYNERITPDEHREVREILEAAVAATPDHSDCLAALSLAYWHEHAHGYNVKPEPLGRALAAAQRAVAAAPTNHHAYHALATVFFFQKDFLAFRPAAERCLALNTMDASTIAFLGVLIAYSGDWEYGMGLVDRAMHLNPNHAGWYHFPAFHYTYHKRDYRGALEIALKINMPGYFFMYTALAAVYGQLGEQERAEAALRELHSLAPDLMVRDEYSKWLDAEITEHMMDGLRKAGLEIDGK